jgi:antitoxin (DNA-binding transcriptional repressor) of toxin-antitoxin stability system
MAAQAYIVHMKCVTATEARRNWFKLLDEAANGEVIAIQRNDKKLILKAQKRRPRIPNYKGLIGGNVDDADTWGWEWKGPGKLVPKTLPKSGR